MTKPNRCTECSKLICLKNKSGLCSHCYRNNPKNKTYRKKYQQKPEVREKIRLRYIKRKGEKN